MEKYTYLEHTADAKFQAFGKTIEEAFSNSALAMFNIMLETEKIKPELKKEIKVEGTDLKALLYNWLEELLFLMDSETFFLNKVESIEIKKNNNYELKATIAGDLNKDEYEVHGEVKAVTYTEMEVQEIPENCMVQVVVDL